MIRVCSLDLRLARTRLSSTQVIAISSSRQIPSPLPLITSGVTLFTSTRTTLPSWARARCGSSSSWLLPESRTKPELAETIMADVRTTCEELGVTLGGGHTEITQGLDRPILVGQMLGEVAPTRLVRKTRIAIGDLILLTRGVAIEGTAILAREKSERLRGRVDADLLARAARFLIEPGISVVSAALAAANVGEVVHAMHDPTEGGLATGLFELVAPAGLGLRVIREHIPVFPETDTICSTLALDPLKLIASGALLVAVAPDRADSVLTAIEATGVPVVVIGEVRPSSEGITIMANGAVEPLTPPVRDEIARAFEGG